MTPAEQEVLRLARVVAINWERAVNDRGGEATFKDARDLIRLVKAVNRLPAGPRGRP